MKRVAIVSYHSSPLTEPGRGDAGGMTVYVRAVAEACARLGVKTDIFTRATSDLPRVAVLSGGVRVIGIDAGPDGAVTKQELSSYIDDFAAGVRAFATAQRIPYEVVHSHYWQSGLAAKEISDAWDVPLVHSHHTLGRIKNSYLAPGDLPEPRDRIVGEEEVNGAADALIASTEDEWQQLACLYRVPHDRLKTVYPGVDHTKFAPGDRAAARAELGLGREALLLYVGRIQPLKGLDLALQALEQLVAPLDRQVTLLVVGGASGPSGTTELERLHDLSRRLGIADRVHFVGPQDHSSLPTFYRAADALVVCSHSESFGLAALEAQACGTPVVATAVGGLAHIVADGVSGFLLEARDPSIFAARLKTLLADKKLSEKFRVNAIERARVFSWDRAATELLDLYECLRNEQYPELCTC